MQCIDLNFIKVNDIFKFINPDKTLFDGTVKKVFDNCIGIVVNTKQKEYKSFNKGQFAEFIVIHDNEALRCLSTILGCKQDGFELSLIIDIPKFISGIERREFQRLPIIMDIEYSPLPDTGSYNSIKDVEAMYFRCLRKTYTIDISGGGICFMVSKDDLPLKLSLVTFTLKNDKITTICKEIRTENTNDFKYNKIGFKYYFIEKQQRQLILDFVSQKSK